MEKQELYDMCKSIEIEDIIQNHLKYEKQIERKLDEMLDILLFYETDDSLLTFRKLCKYYFDINPQATVDYINYYREQNDPEGVKFGNRKK